MFFSGDFLSDPINIVALMAGLALVVSLTTALHYSLDRKAMIVRMKNLEAAMNISPPVMQESNFRQARERQVASLDGHREEARATMVEGDPDPFPQGMRFV